MKKLAVALLLIASSASAQVITPAPSGFQRLYVTGTSVGNGADTTEDTLQTYTISAGQLANVGDVIHLRTGGTLAASTDAKAVRLKVGNQLVASLASSAAGVTAWALEATIIKTGANGQSYVGWSIPNSAGGTSKAGTLTLTDTSTIQILVTGQNTTNPVAGSVTAQMLIVDYEH